MVDEYLSEREQADQLRRWLRENWIWLVAGVVLTLAGYYGYRWWEARQAGRAADFHRYLASWHQPRLWKRMLAPFVRRLWGHHGRCLHKPGEHWCRSRDTQIRVPPLGPLQPEGDR